MIAKVFEISKSDFHTNLYYGSNYSQLFPKRARFWQNKIKERS